jgi:hypothetical protein
MKSAVQYCMYGKGPRNKTEECSFGLDQVWKVLLRKHLSKKNAILYMLYGGLLKSSYLAMHPDNGGRPNYYYKGPSMKGI